MNTATTATTIYIDSNVLVFNPFGEEVLASRKNYETADRCVGSVFESLTPGERVRLADGEYILDQDLDLVPLRSPMMKREELMMPFGVSCLIDHVNGSIQAIGYFHEDEYEEYDRDQAISECTTHDINSQIGCRYVARVIDHFRESYEDGGIHPHTIKQLKKLSLIDGVMGQWDFALGVEKI
jgi:hypothetical protein